MRISDWSSDVCSSDLKAGYRVSTGGNKTASIDGQAYSLSGQYHFGAADNIVRPFVGLGYHETNYSNEKADGAGALAGQRIAIGRASCGERVCLYREILVVAVGLIKQRKKIQKPT